MDPTARWLSRRPCTSAVPRPLRTSLNFEVENFRLFGSLRRTATTVHNSLPSLRNMLDFEQVRRCMPDDANYVSFYRRLTSSIRPATPRSHVSISLSSTVNHELENHSLSELRPRSDPQNKSLQTTEMTSV
ncbi:uncharacterized protein LOC112559619 [Pomacea canaliculata]|uniref:uncharacterized protein LOC112559619 n=1 Tax=Pomacea canaliculata TaxID=400727 RepID=UPI000D7260CB|nr:uncharacterized protein LOC112559619 [Pomacea canaliculata]